MFTLLFLAQAANPETNLQEYLKQAFEAVQRGNWKIVAALGVVGVVGLLRKYGGKITPFLEQKHITWLLAPVIGALAALGTALGAGKPLGGVVGVLSILLSGAGIGLAGIGLHQGGRQMKQAHAAKKAKKAAATPMPPA